MDRMSVVDRERIRERLLQHDAVEQASVVEEEIRPGEYAIVAYVVSDKCHAGAVRRACELEAAGTLGTLSLYEPDANLLVAQMNRLETDFLFQEIFQDNIYLRGGMVLKDNACVIDVGANIGMFSLYAALRSEGARIIAVEPIRELCQAVSTNAMLHNVDIKVINYALGEMAGTVEFTYYPHNTVMSTRFADVAEDHGTLRAFLTTKGGVEEDTLLDRLVADRLTTCRRECIVMTLSQLVEQEGIDRVDLLKVDVEKAEMEVLAGVREETWVKIRQVVIEVHDIAGRVSKVLELLQGRGFTTSHIRDHRLCKTNCFTVYGYRSEDRIDIGEPSPSPRPMRWSGRKRLIRDLVGYLSQYLPAQRALERIEVLAALPAGVDRERTCREQGVATAIVPTSDEIACGKTPTESLLIALCRDLFNTSDIEVNSDFFDLGGNSLSAIVLISRVESVLGKNVLPPDILFENGQLKRLAAQIDTQLEERQAGLL